MSEIENAQEGGGASLSPFKQNLIKNFQKKFAYLREKKQNISFSFSNSKLNGDMTGIFAHLGFSIHTTASQDTDNLLKRIPLWLYNNNTVLLHYRPESGDGNLINLLRAIKSNSKKVSFNNLIPVFFVSYSSKKQMEIFRILGVFGIRYVMFVSPGVPLEVNQKEILEELVSYGNLLKSEESLSPRKKKESKIEADTSDIDINKLKKYEELIQQANVFMEGNEFNKAIELFTQAVELNPDCGVLLSRGDAYFRQKNYVPALMDYRHASQIEGSIPEPYAKISSCCFILVKKHLRNGEGEEAKKKLALGLNNIKVAKQKINELVKKNADSPEKIPENPYAPLIATLVDSDIRNMGVEDAEKEIDKLTSEVLEAAGSIDYLDPSVNIDVRIDYALLMTRNHQYEKAEKILRAIIKEDVQNVGPVFNNFAVELRKSGQNGKSFEIYSELLTYDIPDKDIVIENHKIAGLRYGNELRDDFKMDEALSTYKKILEFRPKGREWVLCELAMSYLELQDQAQASCRLMEAIYINPDLMEAKHFAQFQDLKNLRAEMVKKLTDSSGLSKK